MTTTKLRESTGTLTQNKGKFRIRLLSEGVGSSATYPADVLERDGSVAFPAGTQIFLDHLTESEDWERNGNHSIKDLVGVTLTDAEYMAGDKALEADAKFFSQHADFIEEVKEHVGLSIEAAAIVTEGVVETLVPSPLNAIAVVPRAGRDGKVISLIESYRERNTDESDKLPNSTVTEGAKPGTGKDQGMTPDEIKQVAEAVADALKPTFTALQEALTPEPAEEEQTEAPDVAEVAEAIAASGLPEAARKRVYEGLKVEGADVKALIEAENTYIAELKESAKKDDEDEGGAGIVRESKAKDTPSGPLSIAGWN